MSTTALPDVERWRSYATQAGKRWGIPPAVLLGLMHEESGGREGLTSSTGAKGLTQFEPAAAGTYHVDTSPGHAQSQIDGAAHYLHDLGFAKDPTRALASYAAGPGDIPAGMFYARNVLSLSHLYAKPGDKTPIPTQTSASTPTSAPGASSSAGGFLSTDQTSGLLYAVVFLLLVGGGIALAGLGLNGALGGAPARGARAATNRVKTAAAVA